MPNTRSRGELLVPFDLDLNRTLRRMVTQQNPLNCDDGLIRHPPPTVDAHNQVVAENQAENAMKMQPSVARPQELG